MSWTSEIPGKGTPIAEGNKTEEARERLRKRVDELLGKFSKAADEKRNGAPALAKPSRPAAPKPLPPKIEQSAATGEHRALVVEGNPLHRKVLVRALEKSGYEVDALESAAETLELFQRCPVGFVLLDCDTPEIDGYGTAASLRLIEGTARHTPIVGLTGNAGQAHRKERKAAGIDNYLLKPFRRERVDAVLSRYAPTRALGPVSQLSALDRDRIRELQELTSDDPSLLQELIDLFLSGTPQLLEQMRRAVEDDDAGALRRAAHTLKGSSGQMGALRMQEICGIIDSLAGTGSLVGVDALLVEVSLAFERAVGELKSLVQDIPDGTAEVRSPAQPKAKSNEILLAEDDMLIARFLGASLTAAGFRVDHVRDGQAAIDCLKAKSYSVVILDINMPEVDGYQVLSEIRATVGDSTPVTIISSRHQEQDILRAFDLGVDDYLTKPFNPSEVVARVRRLARQAARS